MGKKDKNKEKDNVKTDNVRKESTKVDNIKKASVKDTKQKVKRAKKSDDISIISLISATVLLGLSVIAYVAYKDFTRVPEMPELDLNKWWGQNSTVPNTAIRPYKVVFSEAMELDIRFLFEIYRRGNKKPSLENTAWTYGVNTEAFEHFFDYWIFKYSFRDRARFLNKFDHYLTNIQGLDIHFIHVKPKVDQNVKVLPLLLLHGWPGSVREFYEAIPLLTTPRKDYNFVFEVIVPSIPGFIFSEAPARSGLAPYQIAIIMRNLMQRLGFKRYYIQGGDFGHSIGSDLATIFPNEVLGFHTNFAVNFAKHNAVVWLLGAIWPTYVAGEHADKWYPLADKAKYYLEEFGYVHLQGTKPDTIGIALEDCPAGLATYILDRMMIFTDPANKLEPLGGLDKYYSYDKLIDNIMLYWISNSMTTAMRLYKEAFAEAGGEQVVAQIPTSVPTWGLRFKHELAHSPDFVLKWKYPNLVGTSNFDFGGHFAAFERPEVFSDDVFKAVKAFLDLGK